MATPITIRQLRKHYGQFIALDDVNLDIRSGEFLTLLGPSGSGKTTLLMSVAGFSRPNRGSIIAGDEEIVGLAPHKRNIGMVFQHYALFPHMSVFDNVAYPLRLRHVDRDSCHREVRAALERVHLKEFADRMPDQLSGGQRQRVALARAIVFKPRILLMDEPLSALDKKLREQMQLEIRQLHERLGMTTIYVTHDQREALTMSDRVAVMNDGRIQQIDTPRALYDHPASRFVADFIGESSILALEPHAEGPMLDGHPLLATRASDEARALVIRPEKLIVLETPPEHADEWNILTGHVRETIYQGETTLAHVELSGGRMISLRHTTNRHQPANRLQNGLEVKLGLHRDDTILVKE